MPPRTVSPAAEPKQERAHRTRARLLDAAVDELLDHGYSGLTLQGVAHRAQVSRGAQQNYFPHKATLVAAAAGHLAKRQTEEVKGLVAAVPSGSARVRAGLDVLYAQYSGSLFAAMVELSLAARKDAMLAGVIMQEERAISKSMQSAAAAIFGAETAAGSAFAERWSLALSTIRGVALLKLLGHPPAAVDRQWEAIRRQLITLLA